MASESNSVGESLTRKLERAQKLPQAEGKVALQIVPIRLRAWVVDQDDVVCRPFYIACLELYPRGKVLNARIHAPASEQPEATALLNFLVDHMLDPPSGEKRERPTHVSFLEMSTVAACAPALAKLQIHCDELSMADGVADYVKMFSDKLVKMERASRGDSAENPGLLSVKGVTATMIGSLMKEAVAVYHAAPWKRFQESIALEVTLPTVSGIKVRHSRYYLSVLGSSGKITGFAVMASLKALRTKFRRSVGMTPIERVEDDDAAVNSAVSSEHEHHSRASDDELLCARCGARVGEQYDRDGGRYVFRCGGCKCLLYCDEDCQKSDWTLRHRDECRTAATNKQYTFHRPEWAWLRKELALLYVDPTSVPFDDLDATELHKWPIVDDEEPPLYPMAFVTDDGSRHMRKIDRPSANEVRALTLMATALIECTAPPPEDGAVYLSHGVKLKVAEDLAKAAANSNATST